MRFLLCSAAAAALLSLLSAAPLAAGSYTLFESGQTRPLAVAPDGARLYALNTPDNRLEVFDIRPYGLRHTASVPVGLEPIALAALPGEVWVVNHLSDSVSIVDTAATPPRVTRTLLVGDEPGDIVFAGPGGTRAFVTTAHRGQNSPHASASDPGQLITPGVGRADVWVFDATAPGSALGGTPITVLTLFGDTPRALTTSPDGSTVYAAVFKSGNRTTVVSEGAVCNGGSSAAPCAPCVGEATAPGGLPAPNVDADAAAQPEVGLIVQFDPAQSKWVDELDRDWSPMVRFDLPDSDVFAIDANADPPVALTAYAGVGTVLFHMATHPTSGKVYVANTAAQNLVRFEGDRDPACDWSSVQGHLHEARITVIDPAAISDPVSPRHLNKHIDYATTPAPAGTREKSLATPSGLAFSADGATVYVSALGSNKVGVLSSAALEADSFVPAATDHIQLSGGGPSGLAIDEANDRLYVLTRFDNTVSVVDLASRTESSRHPLHSPEPASVVDGRPFLYDAFGTSSNGEASCASCHIFGDKDELAWDLGDPCDSILTNPNPFNGPTSNLPPLIYADFHPLKGPMTTQTLRGLDHHGPMHWRGDRTAGNDPGGDPLDEESAFKKFNPAFQGLLGRDDQLAPEQMQAFTDFVLQITPPPNPIRRLDDSLTPLQAAGETFFFTTTVDGGTCAGCHDVDPTMGFFGTDGRSSFEGETQHFKIAQLRNLYEKVGMFGMPQTAFVNKSAPACSAVPVNQGDQVRGFGFIHDGSFDTVFRFLQANVFDFGAEADPTTDEKRRQVEQFLFAFDSNLKPIVGQQLTVSSASGADAHERLDLMLARAAAGDAELVVKGTKDGAARGWYRRPSDGLMVSDRAAEPPIDEATLRAFANTAGQELTYTCAPPGSAERLGIDRDSDAILDGDDNCPGIASPDQTDADGDGLGAPCDNCDAAAERELDGETVDATVTETACETLGASDYTITATGDVTFQAGFAVVLRNGFAAASGASFRALLDPALAD